MTTLSTKHIKRKSRFLSLRSLSLSKGRLAALFALLFFSGAVWAQTDSPYVIKVRGQEHYLAHVYNETTHQWEVKDATSFSPDCLWYSGIEQNITGTHHNYYFIDEANKYRFLSSQMIPNDTPSLSDGLPPTYLLSNTDTIYYFYDWDSNNGDDGGGVARGHQYYGYTSSECAACGASWQGGTTNECWRVYWIAYKKGTGWENTFNSYYDINEINNNGITDTIGGRYFKVTANDVIEVMSGSGLTALGNFEMDFNDIKDLSFPYTNYVTYSYKKYSHYSFEENHGTSSSPEIHTYDHYYYDDGTGLGDHPAAPATANGTGTLVTSYEWTLSGPGADYLSFAPNAQQYTAVVTTTNEQLPNQPKLYYRDENTYGETHATLKLKVTYDDGATQESTATVTVKTQCQHPERLPGTPIINYEDVLVKWYDIADRYKVYWRIKTPSNDGPWSYSDAVTDNFYALVGLEPDTQYEYKVHAFCGGVELTEQPEHVYDFTTRDEHELLVYGAVFGGGRMADVTGKTEVVVVNCDSIGAIYGGNDIAGEVKGAEGSSITLGNNTGTGAAITSSAIKVGAVYGGGNGYYAYNNSPGDDVSFSPVAASSTTVSVASGNYVIGYNELEQQWVDTVWTNTGTAASLKVPSITKTSINVVNDYVKVDTIFGGARNAFVTHIVDYDEETPIYAVNGSSIVIDGGTMASVFGGNNVGGSQGTGKHYIKVDEALNTATSTNYQTRIHTLYGGGNKVEASSTDILVNGGMIDTLYAGGNSADVAGAKVKVDCALAAGSGTTFGHVYSSAIQSYSGGTLSVKDDYSWNGTGVYNITTLFGGNNQANMAVVPKMILTSGSIGTVYGGGNAGDMVAEADSCNTAIAGDFGPVYIDYANDLTVPINISTYVLLNSPNMIIDYLYGGCQMSNVYRSTWVQMRDGHVGTVYGGCNISGDVGSRYLFSDGYDYRPKHEKYQAVLGATYVKVSGGHIYRDLFAGSNGRYHCNNGKVYVSGIDFDNLDTEGRYIGLPVPSHNETHVYVSNGEVDGNVYAGGNLACVGFIKETTPDAFYTPVFVGMATVRMSGGLVHGSVFGGGNMASIWGSNGVSVEGGTIEGALYGGNDRIGLVAQITNRVLPPSYGKASDNYTSLEDVRTYISITGRPVVNTVYGGGNGDYDYSIGQYCNPNDEPVQSNTFVDVNIDGYAVDTLQPGHIHTVYGGGNGVTVTGTTTVFLNVKGDPDNGGAVAQGDHVDFIFGGNNKGPLAILPDIILLKGNVNTVYGGCNQGSMIGNHSVDNTYHNIGSLVRLRSSYPGVNNTTVTPTAVVTGAVYGGCRMNGVSNNSLVLVEGGSHPATVFGGSDISGAVMGTSQVAVTGGTIGDVYGGGNGNYDYESGSYEGLIAPYCKETSVSISGGTASNLYAGGYAGLCGLTDLSVTGGTMDTIFGGGNKAGTELSQTVIDPATQTQITVTNDGSSTVTMQGGSVSGGVYGGCNAQDTIVGNVVVHVTGGTVGTSTSDRANVHGGGFGALTATKGDVTVNIASEGASSGPTLYGDVYGGSALGQVSASDKLTQVNFYKGTVNGDVYGGGLGNDDHAAEVSGDVVVNIKGGVFKDASGVANNGSAGGGRIFGCNNANGTPKGNVEVHIYETDHGTGHQNNAYPTNEIPSPYTQWSVQALNINSVGNENYQKQTYAIRSVYGGGNLAAYTPNAVASPGDPHSATVYVHNCDNTIQDVFGGGKAANVGAGDDQNNVTIPANTFVIIDGGRIHRVIGGGDGEGVPAEHKGAGIYGVADTKVYAGLIDEVYGGANQKGYVDAINLVMSNPSDPASSSSCSDQVYGAVFGCANAADYNRSVTTTIKCGVGEIGELYGGSNLAFIGTEGQNNADVTLNVYGGEHLQVFAGSKGDLQSLGGTHTDKPSHIYGDVTLNLFGGKITDAYGGCNYNGNIAGKITVNVLDVNNTGCTHGALDVTNIYGASNLANYNPDNVTIGGVSQKPVSPVVNVIHIAQDPGVRGNVFGGGNQATVNANPQVNIGYDETTMASILTQCSYTAPTGFPRAFITGDAYGGGNLAAVTGTDTVNMRLANSRVNNIYGGGNQAGTSKTAINVYNGTVATGIYGGCNTEGLVTGDIDVNIYNGTLGTSSAKMPAGIFGGGKGHSTGTGGNITVTIGEGTNPTIYADVYGGSAFGEVGDAGTLAKVNLKNGKVYGKIFGGGQGDNSNSATVTGSTEIAIEGGQVLDSIFGGCNVKGIVIGNATVDITGGTMGAESGPDEVRANVYGGGLGENTKVSGSVAVSVNNPSGHVYGDVYGGSAKGLVNCNAEGTGQQNYSKTNVTLSRGTIHGDLYGGGHGLKGHAANVYGPVTVTVENSDSHVTNVFGCNNVLGAPMDSVVLNVTGGTIDSIFGGGNVAAYVAPYITGSTTVRANYPEMNISGGTITHKVVGGGNNIPDYLGNPQGITGNPHVNISGGNICYASDGLKAGVYGGCNTKGVVNGDIFVTITGDDDDTHPHHTQIGTDDQLHAGTPISVHGGGYGAGTSTLGSITVTFGADEGGESSEHCEWPMLYGDLYGGSALGHVNTAYGTDSTNVNVLNGSVKNYQLNSQSPQYGGNIYGGGLGDANHAATVYGKVHVNIGGVSGGNAIGQASLKNCNVYGCNNKNGSPQKDVFVDVYKTHHIPKDSVAYINTTDREYAIKNVYGGGNQSHYAPYDVSYKAYNYIHFCDNTIERVYGGGNAADALGVEVNVDGGRFYYIFGGGNGQVVPANIGEGGINLMVCSGRVGYKYVGCDEGGNVLGPMNDLDCDQAHNICEDDLTVEFFFFGANKATIIGGLIDTIFCHSGSGPDPMHYTNVYAGSRLAVIYGDIHIVVQGGEITNLFGGSQGSVDKPAHVRRYPATQAEWDNVPADAQVEMQRYMELHPGLAGTGGNIYMKLEGGTLTNVFGGNELYGDVDGDIIIIVDSKEENCQLSIDTIYGGNMKAIYNPYPDANGNTRISPQVYVKNGTVNYDVFGGSLGNTTSQNYIQNGGQITSKPYVVIGGTEAGDKATVGRNVFGGGSKGKVIGDAEVVIRGTSTINGNVFGGAKESDVVGNTDVKISPATSDTPIIPDPLIPDRHTLTFEVYPEGWGEVEVTDSHGNEVLSGASIAEGAVLHIVARTNVTGKRFKKWSADYGVVTAPSSYSTSFIMGTQDAILTAEFENQ